MSDLPVLLTFDDGPHQRSGDLNRTRAVMKALSEEATALGHPVAAVFFVQTHATDKEGGPARLNSKEGIKVAQEAIAAGHVLQIHGGSSKDHAYHTSRAKASAYDVNGDKQPDGQNGLESDLIRAIDAIGAVSGSAPKYVRATYLARNQTVNAVYGRLGLKHVGANVVSGDADAWTAAEKKKSGAARRNLRKLTVIGQLNARIKAAIDANAPHVIVLLHDIHPMTCESLKELIDEGVKKAFDGTTATPKFVQSANEALQILQNTTY